MGLASVSWWILQLPLLQYSGRIVLYCVYPNQGSKTAIRFLDGSLPYFGFAPRENPCPVFIFVVVCPYGNFFFTISPFLCRPANFRRPQAVFTVVVVVGAVVYHGFLRNDFVTCITSKKPNLRHQYLWATCYVMVNLCKIQHASLYNTVEFVCTKPVQSAWYRVDPAQTSSHDQEIK